MYKIKEAAKKLEVSESWLNKKIKEGKIKVLWFGGVRRIQNSEMIRIKHEGVK